MAVSAQLCCAQHSCALTAITDAQPIAAVYCWGSNTRDQLGTGLSDTNDPSVVTIPDEAVDNPVVSVHAGAPAWTLTTGLSTASSGMVTTLGSLVSLSPVPSWSRVLEPQQ